MKKSALAVCLTGVLLVMGCGASSKNESAPYPAASMSMDMVTEEMAEEETGDVSGSGIEPVEAAGRKLIRTVSMEMQTKEFDAVTENLNRKIQELGGYIENSSVWGSNYDYENTRSAEYAVRIPADRLDEFVAAADEIGNIVYKNESVDDVTLEYVDVESHKKALETEQTRLLELMEQAESLEDLLTIESRLSQVRYELESYGSRLRVLDNQVDYSTVHLTVTEVERITGTGEKGFFGEISDRFQASLYTVGRGIRNFVIIFAGSLPLLAVWAVVIGGAVLLLRRIFGEKRTKKEKKRCFLRKKEKPEEDRSQKTEQQ